MSTNGTNGKGAYGPNGHGANGKGNGTQAAYTPPADGGKLIVITAPLTEAIDHAGYFIQMGMASMPKWLEFVMDKKYPSWRNVERYPDGQALYIPAGVRLIEVSLAREFPRDDIVACYPEDLPKFIGPRTRVVVASTHNPLGVTFAAGVYTSIFGSSKAPINSYNAREMFEIIKSNPHRKNFKVIVGASGISFTNSYCHFRFLVEGAARKKHIESAKV